MTLVVIDASAGVEIVCDTRRGRALARLLPVRAEGWVPEHFYSEVLGVLRWQLLGQKLSESQASVAVRRLGNWHLRHASIAPLVPPAWRYRHNLTAADALYVALADQLGASLLTDDRRLVQSPTFPPHVPVLRLPGSLCPPRRNRRLLWPRASGRSAMNAT